jgi:GNAT superfamily N-acetyltransferase
VVIRTARIDDDVALRTLWARWTEEQDTGATDDPGFTGRFSSWLAHDGDSRRFWLALARDRPVGMVNLLVVHRMPRPGRPERAWGYLGNLFVVPERRREGVASRLVEAVFAQARRDGLVHVLLHPNEDSLSFWRSLGLRPAGDFLLHELV